MSEHPHAGPSFFVVSHTCFPAIDSHSCQAASYRASLLRTPETKVSTLANGLRIATETVRLFLPAMFRINRFHAIESRRAPRTCLRKSDLCPLFTCFHRHRTRQRPSACTLMLEAASRLLPTMGEYLLLTNTHSQAHTQATRVLSPIFVLVLSNFCLTKTFSLLRLAPALRTSSNTWHSRGRTSGHNTTLKLRLRTWACCSMRKFSALHM